MNTLILLSSGAAVTWAHHAILAGYRRQAIHTGKVQTGLRYGMILFIVSKIIFFAVFFWALFDSTLPVTIWALFDSTLPVSIEIANFLTHSIKEMKLLGFYADWRPADWTLFTTCLVAGLCCTWVWVSKKREKYQKDFTWLGPFFTVSVLITSMLFCVDEISHKQIYEDLAILLALPSSVQVGVGIVILSLLLVYFGFVQGRRLLIAAYGLTSYYLMSISIRTVLFFCRSPLEVFLFVMVGLLIVAIINTVIFSKKKHLNWMKWGETFIETLFYLQIVVAVAYLLGMVFSQTMPCSWLYQTITLFLFEAAVCVSKLFIQINQLEIKVTPIGIPRPGGLLWSNYREGVSNIIKLVIAKHTPALLGIEEGSYEAEKKVLSLSTSLMMQPGAQGGGYPVPMGGQPVLHPSGVNVPYAPSSASSFYDFIEQRRLNDSINRQIPLLNCLGRIGVEAYAQLGSVLVITDGRGFKYGTFVAPVITGRASLPLPPNGHCEVIINGAIFHWTPYSFNQLEKHVIECNQLDINKENPIQFQFKKVDSLPKTIWYGGYRYISSDKVIPNVPSLIVNGKYFILESPQPAQTVAEYMRGMAVAIKWNNPIIGGGGERPLLQV